MKKQSKWQERLDEMVEKFKKENPITDEPETSKVNLHNTDRHWNDRASKTTAKHWIPINQEKPPYYTPVDILTKDIDEHQDWHRLHSGDHEFYGNLDDNKIINGNEITHWAKRKEQIYKPYNPMTMDDLKYDKLSYDLFYQSKEVGDGNIIISKTLLAETLRKACDRNYQPK